MPLLGEAWTEHTKLKESWSPLRDQNPGGSQGHSPTCGEALTAARDTGWTGPELPSPWYSRVLPVPQVLKVQQPAGVDAQHQLPPLQQVHAEWLPCQDQLVSRVAQ